MGVPEKRLDTLLDPGGALAVEGRGDSQEPHSYWPRRRPQHRNRHARAFAFPVLCSFAPQLDQRLPLQVLARPWATMTSATRPNTSTINSAGTSMICGSSCFRRPSTMIFKVRFGHRHAVHPVAYTLSAPEPPLTSFDPVWPSLGRSNRPGEDAVPR